MQVQPGLGGYKNAWLLVTKLRRAMAAPGRSLLEGAVEVKAARDVRAPLDSAIAVDFDRSRLYFFDAATGARLRA